MSPHKGLRTSPSFGGALADDELGPIRSGSCWFSKFEGLPTGEGAPVETDCDNDDIDKTYADYHGCDGHDINAAAGA